MTFTLLVIGAVMVVVAATMAGWLVPWQTCALAAAIGACCAAWEHA